MPFEHDKINEVPRLHHTDDEMHVKLSYDLRLKVSSNALTSIISKIRMKLVVVGFGLAVAGTIRDDHGHDHDHDIEGKAYDRSFHVK